MKNASFYFTFLLLAILSLSCEPQAKNIAQPKDELGGTLDLSGLDIKLQMSFDEYVDVGYASPEKLQELFIDVSSAVMESSEVGVTTTLFVGKKRTRVLSLPNDDDASGFTVKSADWRKVGKGRCTSEECVRGRVLQVYDNVPDLGVGECFKVRICRELLGANVAWRVGTCD